MFRFPEWAQGQWVDLLVKGGKAVYSYVFYEEEVDDDVDDEDDDKGDITDNRRVKRGSIEIRLPEIKNKKLLENLKSAKSNKTTRPRSVDDNLVKISIQNDKEVVKENYQDQEVAGISAITRRKRRRRFAFPEEQNKFHKQKLFRFRNEKNLFYRDEIWQHETDIENSRIPRQQETTTESWIPTRSTTDNWTKRTPPSFPYGSHKPRMPGRNRRLAPASLVESNQLVMTALPLNVSPFAILLGNRKHGITNSSIQPLGLWDGFLSMFGSMPNRNRRQTSEGQEENNKIINTMSTFQNPYKLHQSVQILSKDENIQENGLWKYVKSLFGFTEPNPTLLQTSPKTLPGLIELLARQERYKRSIDLETATDFNEEAALKKTREMEEERMERFMQWWEDRKKIAFTRIEKQRLSYPNWNYLPSAEEFLYQAMILGIPLNEALLEWRGMERARRLWEAQLAYTAYPGQHSPAVAMNDFDKTFADIVYDFDPRYPEGTAEDPTAYKVHTLPGGYRLEARQSRRSSWEKKNARFSTDDANSIRRKRRSSPQSEQQPHKFSWNCVHGVEDNQPEMGLKFLTWGGRVFEEHFVQRTSNGSR